MLRIPWPEHPGRRACIVGSALLVILVIAIAARALWVVTERNAIPTAEEIEREIRWVLPVGSSTTAVFAYCNERAFFEVVHNKIEVDGTIRAWTRESRTLLSIWRTVVDFRLDAAGQLESVEVREQVTGL